LHLVAPRIRRGVDVPCGDVVHRPDDRDPPVLNESIERPALLAHHPDRTRHVAAGHGVDERFLLGGRQLVDAPARERVDRLLDVVDDESEVLAARGLGGCLGRSDEADGRGHGTAPRVPHHQDQLRPGHGASVFDAAQHLATRDVPGDADAEDVAHPQVEDQLGGRAGVDATEHDGQGMLPASRGVDLAAEVRG
jgi:hypothetical protein